MTKLNQIIAIAKGTKSAVQAGVTELDKLCQKPALFNGFAKTYKPFNEDDGEKLPDERHRVQASCEEVLKRADRLWTEGLNTAARLDWTNLKATADVVVDEKVLIKGAPVSFLLSLEKTLVDMRTLFSKLPVLDEGEEWQKDENTEGYRTAPTPTHRTKKTQKPIVLAHATEHHPAQTQLITEDVIVGHWMTTKLSGAMKKADREDILERLDTLMKAVKQAREQANMADEVQSPDVGKAIFNFLLEA